MSEASAQYQFIEKMGQIPLVNSAFNYAGSQYNALKESNTLLSSTIVNAGNTALYLAGSAAPMVNRTLGKPIAVADSIAAKGLDLLTETVPVIKKPTEEIIEASSYENIRKYSVETVQNLKDYGYNKVNGMLANPYAQAVSQSVITAVDLTESAVDRYLPAAEGENQNGQAEDKNVIQRVGSLSEKMRRRVIAQAVNQAHSFQKRSQEALDNMRFSVDLIQYAKTLEESGRKSVVGGVSAVRDQAKWLWDELNKEETEEQQEAPKSLDQQILFIARRATRNVLKTYNVTALTSYLPENARKAMDASVAYAADVYSQLSQAQSVKDVSEVALQQMTSVVAQMNSIVSKTLGSILPLPETNGEAEEEKPKEERKEPDNSSQE